jgi:hypothetical protein
MTTGTPRLLQCRMRYITQTFECGLRSPHPISEAGLGDSYQPNDYPYLLASHALARPRTLA